MRSVSFDGKRLDAPGRFVVEDVRRPATGELRVETLTVPGADGVLLRGSTIGPVSVEVDLRAIAASKRDLRDRLRWLAGALAVGSPRKLVISDEEPLYRMAVPQGALDVSEWLSIGGVTVSFLCPSPASYGRLVHVSGEGACEVEVGGTYPTAPVISARPSGGSWRVSLDGGAHLEVVHEMGGAAGLVVDMGGRTARLAGSPVQVTLQSDWLVMEPGRHTISAQGAWEAEWRERWL